MEFRMHKHHKAAQEKWIPGHIYVVKDYTQSYCEDPSPRFCTKDTNGGLRLVSLADGVVRNTWSHTFKPVTQYIDITADYILKHKDD